MKLIVDLLHPADVNFYKNALNILKQDYSFDYELIVLPRPNVVPIVQKEFIDIPFTCVGEYKSSLTGKALCLIKRTKLLIKYLRSTNFDLVSSFGSYGLIHAAYFLKKPSVVFTDEPEYKLSYYSYKPFATRIVSPCPARGEKVVEYRGFKELAYLHPNYFTPNEKVLAEYDIKPLKYVFLREVGWTPNYPKLIEGQLANICDYLSDMGMDIVLSLENKSLTKKFEGKCIILKEPVSDIHSLLHFASFSIMSGDTMARESCLVGTPCIYTGGRIMSINQELEDKSCFFRVNGAEALKEKIEEMMKNNYKERTLRRIKIAIQAEWEDTTRVIIDNLLTVGTKQK